MLESSEMALKGHVWEFAEVVLKDHVLESVGLLGPVSGDKTGSAGDNFHTPL